MDVSATAGGSSLEKHLDKLLASQNLQSTSCIKAIGSFLRNHKKKIDEDDLSNPIKTYQTDFQFIKEDIERFREQKMNHECFQVLHPWAYELDSVDFKYIVNNNLTTDICNALESNVDAQVFWLSFFKPQKACAADEFFEAVRQLCEINKLQDYWTAKEQEFEEIMVQQNYVIGIDNQADVVAQIIGDFVNEALNQTGYCSLRHQVKLYQTAFEGTCYADAASLGAAYTYDTNPMLEYFKTDPNLGNLQLKEIPGKDINTPSILQKREMILKPQSIPEKKLLLKFESVDTEELKNVEITFEGDRAIFKIGEGEANHYQIPNDKKLWETQFMIISLNGQYYIRDLGFVHTSRIKLDKRSEVQIQKGSIVDLGKVVHYHFDKVIHNHVPTQEPSEAFYTMRPSDKNFDLDDDYPHLRARPTWVSADENVDNIQNEINVYADGQKPTNSVGRSMKRDIQIKLKAVSADHCAVAYSQEKGWTITERGKDRLSSNGTFIFMKSMQQMNDHIPSDMIPLHDDMIISFVNYELRVRLNQKTKDEIDQQAASMEEYFAGKYANASATAAADAGQAEEPKEEEKEQAAYTAEVQPNAAPAEAEASGTAGAAEEPAEATPAEVPAAEDPKAEGEAAQAESAAEAKPEASAAQGEALPEATEEELAEAATKISAAYRGKKARADVAAKRASANEAKDSATAEEEKPAAGEEAKAEEPAAAESEKKDEQKEETPAEAEAAKDDAKPAEAAPSDAKPEAAKDEQADKPAE